jgi:hypothetical protein
VGRSAHRLWAIQPTCREGTDFKKAVSQRVNIELKGKVSTELFVR